MDLFVPSNWADVDGWAMFVGIVALVLVGVAVKLAGARWDDWLDERCGRGSVRDEWPGRYR